MKRIAVRLLSVLASAALFATAVLPVGAAAEDGHSHHAKDTEISQPDDNYFTITLTHPDGITVFNGNNYGAYQIFSGSVPEEDDTNAPKAEDLTNPGTEGKALPITNIKWGNAFGITEAMDSDNKLTTTHVEDKVRNTNIISFVYALSQASDGTYKYAFSNLDGFKNLFDENKTLKSDYVTDASEVKVTLDDTTKEIKDISNLDKVNYNKLAIDIADKVSENSDHEWLQAFADILGGYASPATGTSTDSGYANDSYVNYCYKGEYKTDHFEIKVPAGYYMIIDRSEVKAENDAFSARMLFVANNVTQQVKASVPTIDKSIVRDDNKLAKTEAAGVGDTVKFQLKGTLPSNYDLYLGGYQYTFVDTLSKGLTLNKKADGNYDVTVTVEGLFKYDSSDWTWTPDATATISAEFDNSITTDLDPNHHHLGNKTDEGQKNYNYKVSVDSTTDDEEKLTVEFPCLREIRLHADTDASGVYRLGYNEKNQCSVIKVDYSATVNEKAVINTGNINNAYIQYSDNPQSYADTDKTAKKTSTVYTFGLEIDKYDYSNYFDKDKVKLAGAGFVVLRENKDTTTSATAKYQIAKITSATGDLVNAYSILSWTNLPDVTDKDIIGTVKAYSDFTTNRNNYEFKTYDDPSEPPTNEGIVNITGLDAGVEYTFVETTLPETVEDKSPYAQIAPFTITLNAATTETDPVEYTGKLESVTTDENHTIEGGNATIDNYILSTETTDENGVAPIDVINFKYEDLPSTGGMGVYIYYIIGGALIAGAIVLFAVNRKKARKN